jgi:L-amino acid N-acyltransferase YncA
MARIYNQGIEERMATFETEPQNAAAIRKALDQRADRFPSVVAERGGEILAVAWASPYSYRACYAGIAEFSVYTDRAARRQGAGKAALEALLRECEARGFWKVLSRIFVENQPSRDLSARLGFREVGIYRRHATLDGRWRDCVIVEKLLGEALDIER